MRTGALTLLAAALALLLGVACTAATPTPTPTRTPEATPTPTLTSTPTAAPEPTPPPGGVVAWVHPASQELRAGQGTLLEVRVRSVDVGVSGVEVELAFDPQALEVALAGTGNVLGASPVAGLQEVDGEQGVVRVALARVGLTEPGSADGVLVRLAVTAREGATGSTALEVTTLAVADHEFNLVQRAEGQGATLRIVP